MLIDTFNSGIRVELNGALRTIGFEDFLPPTTRGSMIDFELLSGETFSVSCINAQKAQETCNHIYTLMMAAA